MSRSKALIQADAVRGALASTSTCSTSTVSTLQQLLLGPEEDAKAGVKNENGRPRRTQLTITAKTKTKTPVSTRTTSRAKLTATAIEVREDDRQPLTAQEKLALATDVVNLTLK